MSSSNSLRLCESAAVLDAAWRELYESAFPAGHKEPEAKLAELIAAGRMLYHQTLDSSGHLLCFSLVSIYSDFLFLAYLATSTTQRSAGVGSKHMKKLNELLKEQYPNYIGLVLEIEATSPQNVLLADEEKKIRSRRFQFYKRLGAKRACRTIHFLIPPRTADGAEVELDLLYFNFKTLPPDLAIVRRVITEIYQRSYCLSVDDALVKKVLAQFKSCSVPGCDGQSDSSVCSETAESDTSVTPPASTAQNSDPVTPVAVPDPSVPVPTDNKPVATPAPAVPAPTDNKPLAALDPAVTVPANNTPVSASPAPAPTSVPAVQTDAPAEAPVSGATVPAVSTADQSVVVSDCQVVAERQKTAASQSQGASTGKEAPAPAAGHHTCCRDKGVSAEAAATPVANSDRPPADQPPVDQPPADKASVDSSETASAQADAKSA